MSNSEKFASENEETYLIATREVDGDNKNLALWAKAITLAEGDELKARYKYIKLRVEQLSSIPASVRRDIKTHLGKDYISAQKFANYVDEPHAKVIENLREGAYRGTWIKDKMYVLCSELTNSEGEQLPATLGMRWFKWWVFFNLPMLGLPALLLLGAHVMDPSSEFDSLPVWQIILIIIAFIMPFAIAIDLYKRKLWAWRFNWVPIILVWFNATTMEGTAFNSNYISSVTKGIDPLAGTIFVFGVQFVFATLIWAWPNYVYWKKRRSYFK